MTPACAASPPSLLPLPSPRSRFHALSPSLVHLRAKSSAHHVSSPLTSWPPGAILPPFRHPNGCCGQLPHHHELHQDLPQGPQPRPRHRQAQEADRSRLKRLRAGRPAKKPEVWRAGEEGGVNELRGGGHGCVGGRRGLRDGMPGRLRGQVLTAGIVDEGIGAGTPVWTCFTV